MNNETLEQLKIKPIPKKPQQFQVLIQIPSEGVAPNIIDKTSERLINREQFFSDLQENLGVVQKDYYKTHKPSATIKDKGKNYQEISGTYNFPILTVAASYGEYKGETETTTLTLSKSLFDMNFAATFVDAKKLTNSVAATSFNTSKDFFFNVSKTF